jgi:hypothetical protein
MADSIVVVATVALVGIAIAYVRACDLLTQPKKVHTDA